MEKQHSVLYIKVHRSSQELKTFSNPEKVPEIQKASFLVRYDHSKREQFQMAIIKKETVSHEDKRLYLRNGTCPRPHLLSAVSNPTRPAEQWLGNLKYIPMCLVFLGFEQQKPTAINTRESQYLVCFWGKKIILVRY